MQILMVTLGYPKHPGDSTVPFLDGIVRGIVSRGHCVTVVLPYHPEFRHPAGDRLRFVPYRYSPVKTFAPWGFGATFGPTSGLRPSAAAVLPAVAASLYRTLRRELRNGRYDVVHAHWVVPNGFLAAAARRDRRLPLVVTMHGSDVAMAERVRALGRAARWTFSRADVVTATSAQLIERAIRLGADPDRSRPLYLGVDTERFSPRAAPPDTRARLGARPNDFLLACVARLDEVKGITYLVDAVARLEGVALAVVGDGELRGELEQQARSSAARVTFTGDVAHSVVPELLAAADALVVPSVVGRTGRVDGTPSTVPEAMATGRPLITTNVGGIPELARDGVNALVVPEKDPEALAAAVERLRHDAELAQRLGSAGRQFAIRRLSWDATASEFEAVYEQGRSARPIHP
jgi:phosphatidyl-myo-inositol dimannoside synthase